MEKQGATVEVISLQKGNIRSWNKDYWDDEIIVDKTIEEFCEGEHQKT